MIVQHTKHCKKNNVFIFCLPPQGVWSRIHRGVWCFTSLRPCSPSSFSSSSFFTVTTTTTTTNTNAIPPQQTVFSRRSPTTHQEQVESHLLTIHRWQSNCQLFLATETRLGRPVKLSMGCIDILWGLWMVFFFPFTLSKCKNTEQKWKGWIKQCVCLL